MRARSRVGFTCVLLVIATASGCARASSESPRRAVATAEASAVDAADSRSLGDRCVADRPTMRAAAPESWALHQIASTQGGGADLTMRTPRNWSAPPLLAGGVVARGPGAERDHLDVSVFTFPARDGETVDPGSARDWDKAIQAYESEGGATVEEQRRLVVGGVAMCLLEGRLRSGGAFTLALQGWGDHLVGAVAEFDRRVAKVMGADASIVVTSLRVIP